MADKLDRVKDVRDYLEEFFGRPEALDVGKVRMALAHEEEWAELIGFRPGRSPFNHLDHAGMLESLAISAVDAADGGNDVYVSPYAHAGRRRRKGGAVARRHIHADIDGALDMARVRFLGAMAVASGSVDADGRPHGHVYVRLTEDVSPYVHEALCKALGEFLSLEHHDESKVTDVDVLRLPGTFNFKHGRQSPVDWLVGPDDATVKTWAPEDLARVLRLGSWPIPEPSEAAVVTDDDAEASAAGPRPVAGGLHTYADRAIAAELARLDQCVSLGWETEHETGKGWDVTTYAVACNLIEFANSPWSGYTLDRARADLLAHAPADDKFGPHQHGEKWQSAVTKIRDKGRPAPQGRAAAAPDCNTATATRTTTKDDDHRKDDTTAHHTKDDHDMKATPASISATLGLGPKGQPWQDADLRSHQRIAARLAQWVEGRCLYVPGPGWYTWDDRRWAPDLHEVRVHEELTELLKMSWDEAVGGGPARLDKDLSADVKSASTGSGSRSVLDLASRSPLLVAEQMDADPWLLNCPNGTLDLHTLELRPHDPTDRISKMCGAAYDPQATAPEWLAFLRSSLPDPRVQAFLQRVVGMALIGDVREDVLVFAAGVTRAGKGIFADVVSAALDEYAVTVDNELLVTDRRGGKKSAGEESELMRLRGARWAVMSELDRSQRLNEGRMKALTSHDRISAKLMRQDKAEFAPTHTFFVLTNGLPRASATDEAVWARIRVVPWNVSFLGREDFALRDRLGLGLEGVLAWAVDGLRDYRDRGRLDAPEEVLEASRAYRNDNDPLARFLDERCSLTPGGRIKRSDFHAAYNDWARDANEPELSATALGARMEHVAGVCGKKLHGSLTWVGVGLGAD